MHHILLALFIGVAVGAMVGLTGVGGGALLVPLLVLLLDVSPILAVGTGALFVAATKVGAAWSYYRRGCVDTRLVLRMSLGSIPGAILGVTTLAILRVHLGNSVNELLKIMIGVLLIVTPGFALFQRYLQKTGKKSLRERLPVWITPQNGAIAVGVIGGFLVGMTSMGSGSIIMVLLVLFYSRRLQMLVGTDIAHSVVLALVAGTGHFILGNVDFSLLAALLLGSIPAAWIAAQYATSFRAAWLRMVLFSALVAAGISML
ncbi:MAG TPA: sulfite exporter TauE/SafE family protein [Candidatus Acidoferrales bacterium]|nr:sulfite exporter TauE/SafE family protein [Candidatus Acidoferrales bacterium]